MSPYNGFGGAYNEAYNEVLKHTQIILPAHNEVLKHTQQQLAKSEGQVHLHAITHIGNMANRTIFSHDKNTHRNIWSLHLCDGQGLVYDQGEV